MAFGRVPHALDTLVVRVRQCFLSFLIEAYACYKNEYVYLCVHWLEQDWVTGQERPQCLAATQSCCRPVMEATMYIQYKTVTKYVPKTDDDQTELSSSYIARPSNNEYGLEILNWWTSRNDGDFKVRWWG